ncbi:MAG: Gfo/Idh/MocA family oxidoreductase, partial [Bacteroidota bacterium]|nr:Gfo/Idh/MocA family oxidoreductase [Bacteroidota bacterium]
MKKLEVNRRKFLKDSITGAAGIAGLATLPANLTLASDRFVIESVKLEPEVNAKTWVAPRIKFAAIGLNHGHINSQVDAVIRGGGQLVSFFAKEPDLAAAFQKKYPQEKLARSEKEILEDRNIQLVVSASIPDERAPLGIRVMQHGKDFMVDKPGITSLQQLADVRRVQKETRKIYSIMYSERLENRATIKAGELVKAGAIGKVIQTIGLGPHRMNPKTRPEWFFDRSRFGGIICDIGSHQFDQFLFFTGSTKADVVAAQVANVNHSQYPKFEDFGDVMLRG